MKSNTTTIDLNFTLKFGKYKGQQFNQTPKSYQDWLLAQDWFKVPTVLTPLQQAQKNISQLSSQLNGWDGHSSRGAAIYDAMFDAEQAMDSAVEYQMKYCGMSEEAKQDLMNWECAEINAMNETERFQEEYYNR
jgi:uncharacterized protein (DUF3820 family)